MTPAEPLPDTLVSEYFDGERPTARPVRLQIDGADLVIQGAGFTRRVPHRQVRWPERQRHGARLAYLPQQGLISHADGAAWDRWAQAHGLREPWVVRWMQSWRGVVVALGVVLVLAAAVWQWGVPWAGQAVVAALPLAADQAVGGQALAQFDQGLAPSQLSAARQAGLREAFAAAVAQAYPADERPAYTLHLRAATTLKIGPNAFALPGGHIVLTDALVDLLADAPDVLTGVLAHELGHVRYRHGMRSAVQAALLAGAAGLVIGDFSSVLAALPALLGQAAYARDFEREADREAIKVLRAAHLQPSRMVVFFDRIEAWRKANDSTDALPIALASHPADAERKRVFTEADAGP